MCIKEGKCDIEYIIIIYYSNRARQKAVLVEVGHKTLHFSRVYQTRISTCINTSSQVKTKYFTPY